MDETLVRMAIKGDKDALIKLVMQQKDTYYRIAYLYMKNEHDAMDAIQDMIVIIYEKIISLRKKEAFYAWSKKILINICKNKLKLNSKVVYLSNTTKFENHQFSSKSTMPEDINTKMDIENCLNKLKPKHSEILKLKYYLDMDIKTISQVLSIPEGTVKSRLSNAINQLKRYMGGEVYE